MCPVWTALKGVSELPQSLSFASMYILATKYSTVRMNESKRDILTLPGLRGIFEVTQQGQVLLLLSISAMIQLKILAKVLDVMVQLN